MKIQELNLKNFAHYDNISVSYDPNVTLLIGPNGAGKTTIGLTGIHFMFQGIAEKAGAGLQPLYGERFRFIGSKAPTAKGEMILYDEKTGAHITVTRKLTKTGSELSFQGPAGMTLNQQWLTDLFNIFLIAPKRFCELSGKDQAKALGIDTAEYDGKIAKLKQEFTLINRDLKNIGELVEPDKIARVDVTALQAEKETIRGKLNNLYLENKKTNEAARKLWQERCEDMRKNVEEFNQVQQAKVDAIGHITGYRDRIKNLLDEVEGLPELVDLTKLNFFINSRPLPEKLKQYTPPPEPTYIDERPDDSELKTIDEQIVKAAEINQQAYEYEQYETKLKARIAKEEELQDNKDQQYAQSQARLEYIQSFVLTDGMEVNDDGELLLNGKPLKEPYFSTGELLSIIPVLISSQNPELKYVFIQDASLLDAEALEALEKDLTGRGFQLVLEIVGAAEVVGKNCILLKSSNP